jgi:fructose-1,6-bisphosphatase
LKEDTYFGQTVTAMNTRMNGHRSKFVIDKRLLFEKSALSMHCFLVHKENFSMEYFKLGIVRKVRPVELDREESRLINKFRTNIWGLNRIVVTR